MTIPYVFGGDDYGADINYWDDYSYDGSEYDGIAWINDGIVVKMENEAHSKDVVCYIEDYETQSYPNVCLGCSETDMENCVEDSTTLENWCNGDTVCYYGDYCDYWWPLYDDYIRRDRSDAIYYSDCTGTGYYNYWHVTSTYHTVINRKKTWCHSAGSDHFHIMGRYYDDSEPYLYWEIEDHYCESYELCDDDHDNFYSETETYNLVYYYNPCRTVEGDEEENQCEHYEDCYDNAICDGERDTYLGYCDADGLDNFEVDKKLYKDSCGGDGYYWYTDYVWKDTTCSSEMGSADYVCDMDLANFGGEYSSYSAANYCKLKEYATCTSSSQCWNDNGGLDCMGSTGNKICTTGANGKYCYNNDDLQCDSGRCDTTCQATLGNGNSCDEDSDCTSDVCCDGECADNCEEYTCGNYVCESEETCEQDNCCSGDIVNFNTDEDNCGSCGNECSAGEICQQGSCTSCGGTIQAIVKDSENNALEDTKVYLDDGYDGLTDSAGKRDVDVSSSTCGRSYEIEIKCSDNTFCDEKTTTINYDGDEDSLTFICDICTDEPDLYISEDDVRLTDQGGLTNVTATIHDVDISATDLEVTFYKIDNKESVLYEENKYISSISSGESKNVSVLWSVSANDAFVIVSVDPDDDYIETKPNNNVIKKELNPQIDVFLEIKTGLSLINNEIEDYIKKELESDVRFLSSDTNADIVIAAGTKNNNQLDSYNSYTLNNLEWGYQNHMIKAYGQEGISPYNGIVGSFYKDGKTRILVYGTEIDGTIAAIKKFVEKKSYFLENYEEEKDAIYLGREDIDAIRAFDYMHTQANENDYRQNNNHFADVVSDILNDNFGELYIKDVKANDDTVLRVKQVASGMSTNYRNTVNDDPNPVVLARGIHSNLFSWQDFGEDIVKDGKDAWLIETVGGPNQECDTCPDYNFTTLTDFWWPALIAGVQAYSGSDNLSYVGFSLGCSVALESLEKYNVDGMLDAGQFLNESQEWQYKDLTSYPIDTFVGLACPGNFTDVTGVMSLLHWVDERQNTFQNLIDRGTTHITRNDIKYQVYRDNYLYLPGILVAYPSAVLLLEVLTDLGFVMDNKLSTNIYLTFMEWISEDSEPDMGAGITLNKFAIFQGRTASWFDRSLLGENTDGIVPNADGRIVCENINSNNKIYGIFPGLKHFSFRGDSLPNDADVQEIIRLTINDMQIFNSSTFSYNANCEAME